jgi:transaldolase/glucose-6-phosphate isomerase
MHFNGMNLEKTIKGFLDAAGKGDYVAINAFLPRNPEMAAILADLRSVIQFKTRCATTLGFGPRFLHSTGQLHKGGPANGLFLQITTDSQVDLEITGQGMSFGTLERAQALGDYEALAARGRRILRLNFPSIYSVNQLAIALRQSS